MTDNTYTDELNRAADRLARVTDELSQVLERLLELRRIHKQRQHAEPEQPRPRVPLFSAGKDPTLAERFEEELHRPSMIE